ncbi:MAG: HAD-IA family hydrolase, partial [Acidothermales bacterium]|nr:HAD-IA family hydrolase [Acidothermales bacterium]
RARRPALAPRAVRRDRPRVQPAPAAYRLAIDTAGCAPDRVLMVAAHTWDLRGARGGACGPPTSTGRLATRRRAPTPSTDGSTGSTNWSPR